MSEQYSKTESQENSTELVNLTKKSTQTLITNEQTSIREERKIKQYLRVFKKATTLERNRSKPNPLLKQQDSQEQPTNSENKEDEGIQQIALGLQLNPLLVLQESVQKSETSSSQTKLRVNLKLKMKILFFVILIKKEQHHNYLYLSDCQDRSFEGMQKLQASATQLYSPQKQNKDQTSLNQINQEIFQETSYLIKNIKNLYQLQNEPIQSEISNDQKEFYNKYFDKKYIESVIRESKLIRKKPSTGKQIPKKY